MKPYFLLSTILAGALFQPLAFAQTQLVVSTSAEQAPLFQLSYPTPIRVQQAVQEGIVQLPNYNPAKTKPQPIYWLGAALWDMQDTQELETKRKEILDSLSQMQSDSTESEYVHKLGQFSEYIRQLKLGKRIMQPLDIDLIRINEALNPLIEGQYQLILPPRPNTITVLGAVNGISQQPWQVTTKSQDYLDKVNLLDNAENSYVWLIQPNGEAIKQPIAYWNHRAQDIAPGALLYVEFSSPFNGFATLNDNIVELLKNRAL
ncbi:capsule biosynthesis GfcC family protein [Shewanella acanthi]|uniref:capsule biosynthesis GfcC family protein n=1 Tax=Shewanella acanthi TaxID=2864212 RepID=UPI001C660392|nr:capsule biosynthesis GfcC family protein [Shewanella acanthi]QYJ79944.1 capsule biosynthesis GfcC family protein [Shewanella acanthi]